MLVPVRQTEHVSTAGRGGGGSPKSGGRGRPPPSPPPCCCRLRSREGGRFSRQPSSSLHMRARQEDEETELKGSSLPASDLASKDRQSASLSSALELRPEPVCWGLAGPLRDGATHRGGSGALSWRHWPSPLCLKGGS